MINRKATANKRVSTIEWCAVVKTGVFLDDGDDDQRHYLLPLKQKKELNKIK